MATRSYGICGTGKQMARILTTAAENHYGHCLILKSGGRKPRCPIEKERRKLARTTFEHFGSVFASPREVQQAARLFEEQCGEKFYCEESGKNVLEKDIAHALGEVRRRLIV